MVMCVGALPCERTGSSFPTRRIAVKLSSFCVAVRFAVSLQGTKCSSIFASNDCFAGRLN
jgi:hypothetical protein